MSDDDIELTVKMTRGGDSGNKETMKATVSAPDVETLNDRVTDLRDRMEEWSLQWRNIQPEEERMLAEDQSRLGESEA
ncbi:DUF7389 domain-containing protein [Halosimplex marinum]|uniref:DUF7389 domain-containing protein n=1 Tax=Halosimplex marinum TaxID=3396620 RepID=UPI003F55FDFA